jgi:hypothetical protein
VIAGTRDHGRSVDSDGKSRYEYVVTLRLSHPDADPAPWTRSLGLEPDVCERAGAPRIRGNKARQYGTAKCSFWTHPFAAPDLDMEFEDYVRRVADGLIDKRTFFEDFTRNGGEAELFIGFFMESSNTGFDLPATLLRDLAMLQLTLIFDLYDPVDESGDRRRAETAIQ